MFCICLLKLKMKLYQVLMTFGKISIPKIVISCRFFCYSKSIVHQIYRCYKFCWTTGRWKYDPILPSCLPGGNNYFIIGLSKAQVNLLLNFFADLIPIPAVCFTIITIVNWFVGKKFKNEKSYHVSFKIFMIRLL